MVTVLLSLFFVTLVQYLRYIDRNEYFESCMNGVTIIEVEFCKDYIIVHKIEGKVNQDLDHVM